MSEFVGKNVEGAFEQMRDRILMGIWKNSIIKYKNNILIIMTSLEIVKIEGKRLYFFDKCGQRIIAKFKLEEIENISKIFSNKN